MAQNTNQQTQPLHPPSTTRSRPRLVSEPPGIGSNLSAAERYIREQAEKAGVNNCSSDTRSTVSSTTSVTHNQLMGDWRETEINKRHMNEPFRYKYGTPPRSLNQGTSSQPSSTSLFRHKSKK
ncbi:unnamed protein product [Adineta ricciae]|uniref:Uncharacterized protein n=1 Tax=Adineta ricciae TaxID=249248 RepID=A0A816CCH4_ADIRI|nr:unnamed protein product [Adineta ricciae]CAF1618589.1 unnamed protein product [Adineta ricciae]